MLFFIIVCASSVFAARYMEKLNRGVVAVRVNASSVYVGWRMFGTDPADISFNVYRGGVKVNVNPIINSTNFTDATTASSTYYVRSIIGGVEQAPSETATLWSTQYKTIPIIQPPMQTMPDGTTCTSTANDCSTGDLDGDGEYEIVLKWDPTNSKDNSQGGYTGDVFLDAYKLNGTRLWSIDLGRNIRAGAHYTQFQVYDLDSDGKAEVVCKTAPGTKDSSGAYLSMGPAASDNDATDYRNTSGYILSGPEYLTLFKGDTGREAYTMNYNPARGTVSSWGDNYGNRVDRFLACVAYLDGVRPSVVMCRGYYTRAVLVAYDWNGTALTQRWIFDSNTAGNVAYAGQGNHNLAVGDTDGDGKDEIVYGACAINDNGTGMYTTGLGHGDAGHLGKMDPDRAGLQYFQPHEGASASSGGEYRNAATGALLWGYAATGDTGRGLAADIDANYRGWEYWSTSTDGTYNVSGAHVSTSRPSVNFRIYWDGDLQDELLDGTKLDKWTGAGTTRLYTFYNFRSSQEINGTKANPCLSADLLGDWREEVIYRNSNNQELNIFTTTTPTTYRFYTLMHDFVYRCAIAWQNTAYNQPPHVGFYLGDGPTAQPVEAIIYPGSGTTPTNTPAFTKTFTGTHTKTSTATQTKTSTASVTFTRTSTATRSMTPSFTQTATEYTGTPTPFTPSYTSTATGTFTATMTLTLYNSPTYTVTASGTFTMPNTPTITVTVTPTTAPAGYTELQAESACSYDGIFETIHAGFTGIGYANLYNATGSSIMFFVDSDAARTINLTYRYANGGANPRDMRIMVNDVTQPASLLFPVTGAWTAWQDSTVSVDLSAGRNEITIEALTADGGPNMDRISFTAPGVTLADCVVYATPTQIETDTPQETPEPSETFTLTPTVTGSETISPTPSMTPTLSATAQGSPTCTGTVTPSNSPTKTWTAQADSPTVTATVSKSMTVSPSVTFTASPQNTATITRTIQTPSRTITQTSTCSATPTTTATAAEPFDPVVYPNPYIAASGKLKIDFYAEEGCKELEFRLYTSAFRLVISKKISGPFIGRAAAEIDNACFKRVARGTYYYVIYSLSDADERKKTAIGVLSVLR